MNTTGTTVSTRQTLEQRRAAAAWEHVGDSPSKEYVSLVRGASATILTCGLGQTIAFYLSKAKNNKEYERLTSHLAEWVLGDRENPARGKDGENLLKEIIHKNSDCYRELTAEALAYLVWLKRFAEARHRE
ncbi:MAG: type III-B CRISPR module-associated protein Cmr5 [Bacteroidota bacterium]